MVVSGEDRGFTDELAKQSNVASLEECPAAVATEEMNALAKALRVKLQSALIAGVWICR